VVSSKDIEALQQENADWQKRYEELDVGHSKLFKDFCELKQENEAMRVALEQEKEYCNENQGPCELCKIVNCKTKEALGLIGQYAKDGCYCFIKDVADEALDKIAEAMGE
jgi:hypothetical protein